MTADEPVLRVRIDRGRWLRGAIEATLRNPDTCHECIVGAIARAAGIPKERIEKHTRISRMRGEQLPAVLHEFDVNRNDTSWTEDPRNSERRFPARYLLYAINDDPLLGDVARERMLTPVAAGIGIELTFTGTRLPPHAIPPTTKGRARQGAVSRGYRTGHPARRLRLATSALASDGAWHGLDEATLLLDADPEAAWAYAYDVLRSYSCDHDAAVRLTVLDGKSGRTIADTYHEPIR
ncbi:MAG: hypothetical protein OXG72_10640 [Acidobacteria bacterium]|nr:hypothetical protein [Acidobacteriota bacterium]